MSVTYSLKDIKVEVALATGQLIEITRLATTVRIVKPGLPEMNTAIVDIVGLSEDRLSQLASIAPRPLETQENVIRIYAGEAGARLPLIYSGEIFYSFPDFNRAPNPVMHFEAFTGYYAIQKPDSPTSVEGETAASGLFQMFANDAGYVYRNEGVTASVKNCYFSGSPVEKAVKLASNIGCELLIDDGAMITYPQGANRPVERFTVSPKNGLIGYPSCTQDGLRFSVFFAPRMQYGAEVNMTSAVKKANGNWTITRLEHLLSANNPDGGPWQTNVEALYV